MDIVEEIRLRPEAGAKRLVAEYRLRLFQAAFRLCLNAADADDLCFRTLQQAVRRIDTYRSSGSFFQWLYKILINFRRMDLRRKGANMLDFPEDIPEQAVDISDPADTLANAEDFSRARSAVASLPEAFREVVVFRYFEDMSLSEISQVLGIPVGSVKSRLNRAKAKLREVLSGTFPGKSALNHNGETE